MKLFNSSNFLSLLRGPLAFAFLIDNSLYRVLAIVLAMLTDGLDGYLARRYRTTSQFGAYLDPAMDKFFVAFALSVFLYEGRLQAWEALTLLSRDFAVILFAIYLGFKQSTNFRVQSIWFGKMTTALQFFVLLSLIFHLSIPFYIYLCFMLLGLFAFIELYVIEKSSTNSNSFPAH